VLLIHEDIWGRARDPLAQDRGRALRRGPGRS
jgi:hypothetical protein